MKVTVCQLNDSEQAFTRDWEGLIKHVKTEGSDLVLLPELPFSPWFGDVPDFNQTTWDKVVEKHRYYLSRLNELNGAIVAGTLPVSEGNKRFNTGFLRSQEGMLQLAHHKYYLPNEDGFWESNWYDRGYGEFSAIQVGSLKIGFLICTELWFFDQARKYGQQGAHLIMTPRATEKSSIDKWLAGGRAAAVVSGAFSLSSNHYTPDGKFGGQGWVIDPEGNVLGITTPENPFITREIRLEDAERAKKTYPRNVPD